MAFPRPTPPQSGLSDNPFDFPEGDTEPGSSPYNEQEPQEPAPAPVQPIYIPQGPDPAIVAMAQRQGQLENALAIMLARQTQGQQDPNGWQDSAYLSPDDTQAILTSSDPGKALNSVFNKVGKSVHEPLVNRLQNLERQNQLLAYQLTQGVPAAIRQVEQRRSLDQTASNFYTRHPEVAPFESLLPAEAQALAQDVVANPYNYAGKSEADIHALLANRVVARAQYFAQALGAEPPQQTPYRRPAPTAFMERGSGTRPGAPQRSKDPNSSELRRMSRYMRGER